MASRFQGDRFGPHKPVVGFRSSSDEDFDATVASPIPGCPPRGSTCTFSASPGNNQIFIQQFSPDSKVRIEVFESPGGDIVGKPLTVTTDLRGQGGADLQFDLKGGHRVVVTDVATDVAKTQLLPPLSLDTFDTERDIVAGRSNPGDKVFVGLEGPPLTTTTRRGRKMDGRLRRHRFRSDRGIDPGGSRDRR